MDSNTVSLLYLKSLPLGILLFFSAVSFECSASSEINQEPLEEYYYYLKPANDSYFWTGLKVGAIVGAAGFTCGGIYLLAPGVHAFFTVGGGRQGYMQ